MRADRHDVLLDFLLEAVADESTTPFPANVLAGLRRVVRCEAVSYMEWSAQELLEFSLAADDPASILPVWDAYPQVRQDDPLAGGAPHAGSLPNREWLGRALTISDFISDREFRRRGLYAEVCKPLGVRAVMKVFLPSRHGNRRVAGVRHRQEQVHRDRPPHPASALSRTWDSCGATRSREGPIRRS